MSLPSSTVELLDISGTTGAQKPRAGYILSLEGQSRIGDQVRSTADISRTRTSFIIIFLSGVTFISSLGNGNTSPPKMEILALMQI